MLQELSSVAQAVASICAVLVGLYALKQISLLRQQVKLGTDSVRIGGEQITLLHDQIRGDHDRSRRHLAIQDLHHWTNHIDETITSARRLCETFDIDQLAAVRDGRPLRIPKRFRAIADVALDTSGKGDVSDDGECFILPAEYAIRMRNLCIRHLNAFEITLLGWRHSVSDDHIVEEQLGYLVDLKRGWKMLEAFRQHVTGLEAYPAIDEFVHVVLDTREKARPLPRPPIA